MANPSLRRDFTDSKTPGPNQLPAAEYNLNAQRTDEAWDYTQDAEADKAKSVVNVRDYGAVGDGVADDTAAIEAAWAAAKAQLPANGAALYFPRGSYRYNGPGLDGEFCAIIGDGWYLTAIVLGANSYFLKTTTAPRMLFVSDIDVVNGLGAINNTYTGIDTNGPKRITNCRFANYTECAIQTNSSDSPYWWISQCYFISENTTTAVGIAMAPGLTDNVVIESCAFDKNRVGIKIGSGGNNMQIKDCNFLRKGGAPPAVPRIDVWVVPSTTSVNSGGGFSISGCKFGNEGLVAGDQRIVYADQDAVGVDNGTKMPVLDVASAGHITGHIFTGNAFYGISNGTPPLVFSTTPNVADIIIGDCYLGGTAPDSIIDFLNPALAPDWSNSRSKFGPFTGTAGVGGKVNPGPVVSNAPGVGYVVDTTGMLQTRSNVVRQNGSGSSASFVNLLSTSVVSFTQSGSTSTPTTDAFGGSDAAILDIAAGGASYGLLSDFRPGQPVWIELDVKQSLTNPLTALWVRIRDGSPSATHALWTVEVPSDWVTYAFTFTPRWSSSGKFPAIRLQAATSSAAGQVIIGRVRAYHANERQLRDLFALNVGGMKVAGRSTQAVTSSVTLGAVGDYLVFIGASGEPTLPTAVGNTGRYVLKNIHTADRTVATTLSQTIDGVAAPLTLVAGDSVELVSDGANWQSI